MESDSESDLDSLFDEIPQAQENGDADSTSSVPTTGRDVNIPQLAYLTAPPIPGLYFSPDISLRPDLMESTFRSCLQTYFNGGNVNQVMLFERVSQLGSDSSVAKRKPKPMTILGTV